MIGGTALSKASRSSDSRNRQQHKETSRPSFWLLHIARRSRAAERHIGRHEHSFRVVGGIIMYPNRRSRRMLLHPLLERPNLVGRVLPNFRRRNIARKDVRNIQLSAYLVAQAEMNVVTFLGDRCSSDLGRLTLSCINHTKLRFRYAASAYNSKGREARCED